MEVGSDFPVNIGQCIIPLAPVIRKKETNRWYNLYSLPVETGMLYLIDHIFQTKKPSKKGVEDDKRNKPREVIKFLQTMEEAPTDQRAHKWNEKSFALSNCAGCNGKMMGSHYICGECQTVCHQKCKDSIPPKCGSLGSLRVKVELKALSY
jgi:hypothetical protein